MANTYAIKENSNQYGLIALTAGVFETITAITVSESKVVSLADALPFSKPVIAKVKDNLVYITLDIKVKRGVKVSEIVETLQEKIHNTIYQMTDLKVFKIDIKVTSFLF